MHRKAKVYFHQNWAGVLAETDQGYVFAYDQNYCNNFPKSAISKTMPVTIQAYESKVLFPFFDGLIPEGWLLDIALDNWKLNQRDRFGLLLAFCKNTIGAVSVQDYEEL